MKARLGTLAPLCLLAGACACATTTPQSVTEAPALYEQYVVYGGYEDVLASINAKVDQCVDPLPQKESVVDPEPGTAEMRLFGSGEAARLVLKLQGLEDDRTRIDVYAGDLSKLAWSRLRRAIQYGAQGKNGCPDSPQPDPAQ